MFGGRNPDSIAAALQDRSVRMDSHEDMLPDLLPDILIIKTLSGKTQTLYKDRSRNPACRVRFTGCKYTADGPMCPAVETS
ncbi:MAG: hypothetical protein ABFR90_02340 [Planctomycetota bacterium]